MKRQCIECKKEIHLSMGIVLARDFIDFVEGKRTDMREICELCNLKTCLSPPGCHVRR